MKRLIIALCVSAFIFLPVTHAAKPPKPVDELNARVEALEAEVAELKAKPSQSCAAPA